VRAGGGECGGDGGEHGPDMASKVSAVVEMVSGGQRGRAR
jgi:hypothetical protein